MCYGTSKQCIVNMKDSNEVQREMDDKTNIELQFHIEFGSTFIQTLFYMKDFGCI